MHLVYRRGDIRVAVVSYNNKPYTVLNFASPSDRVIKKIGSLNKPGGCGTSLGRAMYMTRRRVVPNTRSNSNKAMFIISTGILNIGTSHPKAARLLESEQSFQIFSIAIGKNPNKRLLSSVVSQPEKSHVIFLRYYGDVFDAVRRTVTMRKRGKVINLVFPINTLMVDEVLYPKYSIRFRFEVTQNKYTHLVNLFKIVEQPLESRSYCSDSNTTGY